MKMKINHKDNEIIVIKIGTTLLTTDKQKLDLNNLRNLVHQICTEIITYKRKFIIVTSGAITCGANMLNLGKEKSIPEKQAAAAVGQPLLMQEYFRFFEQKGLVVGQILLTKNNLKNKTQEKNIINTISCLLELGTIPIINENDSVAIYEIDKNFGDNDQLSAKVAQLVKADKLILLTDIDGVFNANPKKSQHAKLMTELDLSTDEAFTLVDDIYSTTSKGGMKSKLRSAQEAALKGIAVTIANGRKEGVIHAILANESVGTRIINN
jgi:glutamate 5-kinase